MQGIMRGNVPSNFESGSNGMSARSKLAWALAIAAGLAWRRGAGAAGLSQQGREVHRHLSAGRQFRRHGAHHRQAADRILGPAGPRGYAAGRGRRDRHGIRLETAGRRLYVPAGQFRAGRRQAAAGESLLRLAKGFRAGLADHDVGQHPGGADDPAGEEREATRRARQGAPGRAHLRHQRPRQHVAFRRRDVQAAGAAST